MEAYVLSNLIVLSLVLVALLLSVGVTRNVLWRQALRQLWHRRPIAILVLGLYAAVALADSVSFRSGARDVQEGILLYQPRSLVDRLFENTTERSYSAPLARVAFYGKAALRHPGRHWLGTDILGRDVVYVTLKGAKVALLIGGLTSLIAIPVALLFGITAGYFGRWWDDLVFFVISVLASIPSILLLVALIMVLPRGTVSVCLALGVTGWVAFCRLARGETLRLRELDYVVAARTLGVKEYKIVYRHILPNLMHLVVITFVLMFSGQVISEAVLSWLGIGVEGSWGQMIAQAKDELSREPLIWWNLTAAGVALFGLLLAINFVGDAMRDILDPRTVRERE